jgi:hypothetical protein
MDLIRLPNVKRKTESILPEFFLDFADYLVYLGLFAGRDDNICPGRRKTPCNTFADSSVSSGYYGYSIVQSEQILHEATPSL